MRHLKCWEDVMMLPQGPLRTAVAEVHSMYLSDVLGNDSDRWTGSIALLEDGESIPNVPFIFIQRLMGCWVVETGTYVMVLNQCSEELERRLNEESGMYDGFERSQ